MIWGVSGKCVRAVVGPSGAHNSNSRGRRGGAAAVVGCGSRHKGWIYKLPAGVRKATADA